MFRIHYLMLILVFVKAFSVMFHALNYRFLDLDGETDAWTIIFYVVHLLKVSNYDYIKTRLMMSRKNVILGEHPDNNTDTYWIGMGLHQICFG